MKTISILKTVLLFALFSNLAFAKRAMEPKEFDRLDGMGPTHTKVDVIDWEGNLEIHVMPKGKLAGLGLKLDMKDEKKHVLVIEYRLKGVAYTLIRRAIDTVNLKDGFKTYRDTTADDYDKIILSNNVITENVVPFKRDPDPTQLYPDYYTPEGTDQDEGNSATTAAQPAQRPADSKPRVQIQQTEKDPPPPSKSGTWKSPKQEGDEDDVDLNHFSF